MSETNPQLMNRREFLKTSGEVAGAVLLATLPKKLFELDQHLEKRLETIEKEEKEQKPNPVPVAKEEPKAVPEIVNTTGITVVDNKGIEKDGGKVDVKVNEEMMKENILSRAKTMVSEELYPKVEELMAKLKISFGSKNYSDITESWVKESNPDDNSKVAAIKGWIVSRLGAIFNLGSTPLGAYLNDTEHPNLYFNTKDIKDEKQLREVWDHETAHLIYSVDKTRKEDPVTDILERTGITAAVDLLASYGTTFAAFGILAKLKGENVRDFIDEHNDRFKRIVKSNLINQIIPATLTTNAIDYQFFNPAEIDARAAVKDHATPQDSFNQMIRVVPST